MFIKCVKVTTENISQSVLKGNSITYISMTHYAKGI